MFLLLALSGCSGFSSGPPVPHDLDNSPTRKESDSGIDLEPIAFAPPLDGSRVFAQSVETGSRRAWISGLPGAAPEGVTRVCAFNPKSDERACFAARSSPGGVSFNGSIGNTEPGDLIHLWGDGPAYAPGGPGINSIEKTVLLFSTRFPTSPNAFAMARNRAGLPDGLFVNDQGLGLFFLAAADIGKDPAQISPTRFTTRDGLPGNWICSMVFDDAEGLWLGTEKGISRLVFREGRARFTNYGAEHGLPAHNAVCPSFSDRRGGLWLRTNGAGVYRMIRAEGSYRFVPYFQHASEREGWDPWQIRAVETDGENGLWIAVDYVGLIHATEADGRIETTYYTEADGLPHRPVIGAISRDGARGVWFGISGSGVGRLTFPSGLPALRLYSEADGLPNRAVSALQGRGEGEVWIGGAWAGLTRLVDRGGTATAETFAVAVGRGNDQIRFIHFDPDGGLWVGHSSSGMSRLTFPGGGIQVRNYFDPDGLPSNWVRDIVGNGSGGAWIAADGLVRLTLSDGSARYTSYPMLEGVPTVHISSIDRGSGNDLWLGMGDKGIVRLTPSGENLGSVKYTTADGLPAGWIDIVRSDGSVGLWIGGFTYDRPETPFLSRLTFANGHPSFTTYRPADGLTGWRIRSMAHDRSGGVYVVASYQAAPADGVPLLHLRNSGGWSEIVSRSVSEGLPGFQIYDVAVDLYGRPWIATNFGLKRMTETAGGIRVETLLGLPQISVTADSSGAGFWVRGWDWDGLAHLRLADDSLIATTRLTEFDGHPLGGYGRLSPFDGGAWFALSGAGVALLAE